MECFGCWFISRISSAAYCRRRCQIILLIDIGEPSVLATSSWRWRSQSTGRLLNLRRKRPKGNSHDRLVRYLLKCYVIVLAPVFENENVSGVRVRRQKKKPHRLRCSDAAMHHRTGTKQTIKRGDLTKKSCDDVETCRPVWPGISSSFWSSHLPC